MREREMGFCGDADAAMRLRSGATAGAGGGGVRRRAPPLEREVPSPRGGEGGAAWGRDGGARRESEERESE